MKTIRIPLVALVLVCVAELAHAGGTVITQPVGQNRVTGTCVGQVLVAINANGTVVCESDDGTGLTAGAGLTLTGSTLDVVASSDFSVGADLLDLSSAVTAPGTLGVTGQVWTGQATVGPTLSGTPAVSITTGSTNGLTGGVSINRASNDANAANFYFYKTRNTDPNVQTTVANGDVIGNTSYFVTDGTTIQQNARIRAVVNGTVSAGVVPTDIVFQTSATNTAGLATAFTITSGGDITVTDDATITDLTATGALNVGGVGDTRALDVDSSGVTTARYDDNALQRPVVINNRGIDAANQGAGILFQAAAGAASAVPSVALDALTENTTHTGATADGRFSLKVAENGTLLERVQITSAGVGTFTGSWSATSITEGASPVLSGTITDNYVPKGSGGNLVNSQFPLTESAAAFAVGDSPTDVMEVRAEVVFAEGTYGTSATNGLHFGFASNTSKIVSAQPGTSYRALDIDASTIVLYGSGATALTITGNDGQFADLLGVTSNLTVGGNISLTQAGDTYIYDSLALTSGNQGLNLYSAGTGEVRINSNQGGVPNAGTSGLGVYAGANSSTRNVYLNGNGDVTLNGNLAAGNADSDGHILWGASTTIKTTAADTVPSLSFQNDAVTWAVGNDGGQSDSFHITENGVATWVRISKTTGNVGVGNSYFSSSTLGVGGTFNVTGNATLGDSTSVDIHSVNGRMLQLYTGGGNLFAYDLTVTPVAATSTQVGYRSLMNGTYDATAAQRVVEGGSFTATGTRSAGANNVWNIGALFDAAGGQLNHAIYTDRGDVRLNVTSGTTGIGVAPSTTTTLNVDAGSRTYAGYFINNGSASTDARVALSGQITGTFDATAQNIVVYGTIGNAYGSRSSGANSVINRGGFFDAIGGQVDRAIETDRGDVVFNATSGTTFAQRDVTLNNITGATTIKGNTAIGDAVTDAHTMSGLLTGSSPTTNGTAASYRFGGAGGGVAALTYAGNADNNGGAYLMHNAYAAYNTTGDATWKWTGSHASFGARGVSFNYGGVYPGIALFADNAVSTADASFTPTLRMMIANGGNVGIGTDTAPDAPLQVQVGGTSAVAPEAGTVVLLRQADSTNNYLTFQGVSSLSGLRFNNTNGAGDGLLNYDNTNRALYYGTAGTVRQYINSSGSIFVGDSANTAVSNNVDVLTVGNTGTGQTADNKLINATNTGTYDATAAGRNLYGVYASVTATRSAGANSVSQYAIFGDANGAQGNYSGYFDRGSFHVGGTADFSVDVSVNGNATLGNSTSADSHTVNGAVVTGASSTSNAITTTYSGTSQTADRAAVNAIQSGSFDATAAGRNSYAVLGNNSSTRSAGGNNVTAYGVYGSSSGGQIAVGVAGVNTASIANSYGLYGSCSNGTTCTGVYGTATGTTAYAGYFDLGLVQINGNATIGSDGSDAHTLNGSITANSTNPSATGQNWFLTSEGGADPIWTSEDAVGWGYDNILTDETVSETTTPADSSLQFVANTNDAYIVEGMLLFSCNDTAGDIQFRFTTSAGTITGVGTYQSYTTTGTVNNGVDSYNAVTNTATIQAGCVLAGSNLVHPVRVAYSFIQGTAPGTIKMQFSPVTNGAGTQTARLEPGSYLRYYLVSP